MANQNKSGGVGGMFVSFMFLIIIIAVIVGWAKVNNITSISGLYGYFRGVSDKAQSCGISSLKWSCNNSSNGETDTINGYQLPPKDTAQSDATSLSISNGEKTKVNYADWNHWVGFPCNTRDNVLILNGKNVKKDAKTCNVVSGTWKDKYTGKTLTDPGKIDIDMIVPIQYASSHGGANWTKSQKQSFANDTSQLVIVSSDSSKSRDGKSPSSWVPSDSSFRCNYAKMWISTAKKYNLTVTKDDYSSIQDNLKKCTN